MIKQVIVWRNDLKVRKGKFAAQIAHASLGAVLKSATKLELGPDNMGFPECTAFAIPKISAAHKWLFDGRFTKIVLKVDSEEELLELHKKLVEYNESTLVGFSLPHVLITDAGFTEFNGVPTNTCIGIGPAESEVIDLFTGHLTLM